MFPPAHPTPLYPVAVEIPQDYVALILRKQINILKIGSWIMIDSLLLDLAPTSSPPPPKVIELWS